MSMEHEIQVELDEIKAARDARDELFDGLHEMRNRVVSGDMSNEEAQEIMRAYGESEARFSRSKARLAELRMMQRVAIRMAAIREWHAAGNKLADWDGWEAPQ